MVEISLSGSGEGLGRAIARGYSTKPWEAEGTLSPSGLVSPARRATRRAVAKANERVAESHTRMKLICGNLGAAKGLSLRPDGQCRYGRTEAHVSGLPAEAEGGNPGQYSGESSEGLCGRQDDP